MFLIKRVYISIIIIIISLFVFFKQDLVDFIIFTYKDINNFIAGDPDERPLTLSEKILNDIGLTASRYMAESPQVLDGQLKKTALIKINSPYVNNFFNIRSINKNVLRDKLLLFSSKNQSKDGNTFFFLIDLFSNKIIHHWMLNENIYKDLLGEELYSNKTNRFPATFSLSSNGDLFLANNSSLLKLDKCSNIKWIYAKSVHHLFGLTSNEDFIWVIEADFFSKINSTTGMQVNKITWDDILVANPDLFINYSRKNVFENYELEDSLHWNDIEPLGKKYAKFFSEYKENDLLISNRNENTVFILDPRNLKIKDFFIGHFNRQHDPDWGKGFISIFNNNPNLPNRKNDGSNLIFIKNFENSKAKISKFNLNLYTRFEGNHDIEDNLILATSSRQGIIQIYNDSSVIFRLDNVEHKGEFNLVINQSELINKNDIVLSKCE